MKILKTLLKTATAVGRTVETMFTPDPPVVMQATFGASYMNDLAHIAKGLKGPAVLQVEYPDGLIKEIDDAIQSHSPSENVLYDDEMQFIDVVGESFRQEALRELMDKVGQSWLAGFLMPEPLNPHDPKAVSVVAISIAENYETTVVGYLGADVAKRVQPKVVKYLNGGAVIPILLHLVGGENGKPSIGVVARAKTKNIKF
jgi:hypothetical protein